MRRKEAERGLKSKRGRRDKEVVQRKVRNNKGKRARRNRE